MFLLMYVSNKTDLIILNVWDRNLDRGSSLRSCGADFLTKPIIQQM
jgi:hypothetical protein